MSQTTTAGLLARDIGGQKFAGPFEPAVGEGRGWYGKSVEGSPDYFGGAVLLYDANGLPLVWKDMDTGAGTDYALPIALRLPASGGGVNAPGDAANGLDVDVTRLPSLPAGANTIGAVTLAAALPAGANAIGSVDTELPAAAALADGQAIPTTPKVGAVMMGSNGATLDLWRMNQFVTLLASAARTTTTVTANQTNRNHRGVLLHLQVSVFGGGSLTVKIIIPGDIEIFRSSAFAATGQWVLFCYPGATETWASPNIEGTALPLPQLWKVEVTHATGDSITYALTAHLIN